MPSTANKGLEVQVTGSNSGTWGDVLNDSMISFVDLMLGGTTNVSLAAVNVTLSASQARNAICRFTGVLLANVIVTTPCLGFTFFDNATTGNFSVTVQYTGGVGATVVLEQGVITLVCIDGTNGARAEGQYPDLVAINALTGTGVLKRTGTNTWALTAGVTDLAATTANRMFGTDGSGASGLLTTSTALALAASTLDIVAATKANMEAQSATQPVVASVQQQHPAHPKAWVNFNGTTATIRQSYNVTSVVRNSTGTYTVTLTTAFANTNYAIMGTARADSGAGDMSLSLGGSGGTKSAASFTVNTFLANNAATDASEVNVVCFGTQ